MRTSVSYCLLLLLGLSSVALSKNWVESRAKQESLSEMAWLQEMEPVDFLGTTALGGLRPIFIDLLAMRAQDAFARRDWFEALPLAELLCRLQPNLPAAWESNSWNMAYNIAASKKQAEKPEEEFAWVKKGIDFIKKGIRKNQDSAQVHWWLSFLMHDKGRYPEYQDSFASAAIDPSREAIDSAREAAKLETDGFRYHYWFSLLLARAIEEMPSDERSRSMAREGLAALRIVQERAPDDKDFREYREGIDARISFFDSRLEEAKVGEPEQTKKTGDK